MINVLIVGNGGREHALAWKVAQAEQVGAVFVAPGNAGTAQEPKVKNVAIKVNNIPALIDFAQRHVVDLTIVGPEAPLVAGIVDAFEQAGLRCFGPSQQAAQLEGSKQFAKDFLIRHGIPTAAYQSFTELAPALAYIRQLGTPLVIKADGLAAGKGVTVVETVEEAIEVARSLLIDKTLGPAGHRVIIEEFLPGEEASFICMVDGQHSLPLATSQDHKALEEGDQGPNTGGMGAYSPAPVITAELHDRIMAEIIEPTVRGMAAEGRPYRGFLYAGLMIDAQGHPKVLEYNCRFGDPEAQPILLRLRSNFVTLCEAALAGQLDRVQAEWDSKVALGVVLASGGYPGRYETGQIIKGLDEFPSAEGKVFHAGTLERDGDIVTAGGRVVCVCALGNSVREAHAKTYQLIKRIHWPGMYYRPDIGYRALRRE